MNQLETIYQEVIRWKPSFFLIGKNKTGHQYVEVLNTLLKPLADNSNFSDAAITASMVLAHLVLPKTKSIADGSNNKTIKRRLEQFCRYQVSELLIEAKALQSKLRNTIKKNKVNELKFFNQLMSKGKISNAIRLLTGESKGGVLNVTDSVNGKPVLEVLREKHPQPKPLDADSVVSNPANVPDYHPAIFDRINASSIRKAAMKTHGSHGPSGVDADDWRRYLTAFGQESIELCKTLASITKRIASETLTKQHLSSYNACRLIALDKCPGVRPIGIGEVLRRIIGRVIVQCIRNDLKLLGGNTQLCLGQKCGIDHAIHSL